MKNLKAIFFAVLLITGFTVSAQTKKIDISKSNIQWLAKKVGGQHVGTLTFKSGALMFKGNKLAGGSFIADMTSVTATDIDGEYLAKLNGHLKSEDFFNATKFPTATLVFKKIGLKSKGVYTVMADLTIKGITKPVTFNLETTANTATTKFIVDRSKYDVRYGSTSFFDSLGDKAIENDFELKVTLKY